MHSPHTAAVVRKEIVFWLTDSQRPRLPVRHRTVAQWGASHPHTAARPRL